MMKFLRAFFGDSRESRSKTSYAYIDDSDLQLALAEHKIWLEDFSKNLEEVAGVETLNRFRKYELDFFDTYQHVADFNREYTGKGKQLRLEGREIRVSDYCRFPPLANFKSCRFILDKAAPWSHDEKSESIPQSVIVFQYSAFDGICDLASTLKGKTKWEWLPNVNFQRCSNYLFPSEEAFSISACLVHLKNSRIIGAVWKEAATVVEDSDLSSGSFVQCNKQQYGTLVMPMAFVDSDLQSSKWKSSSLRNADLSGSNFENAEGIELDNNYVKETRFGANPKIEWLRVVRDLTGTNLFFNFLFMILFFLPLLAKIVVFYFVAQISKYEGVNIITDFCITTEHCRETYVGAAAFGQGNIFVLGSTVGLLIYNIWRAIATRRAGQLLDEQNRSYHTPSKRQYNWLSISRKWFQYLWLIGAGVALINLAMWIKQPLYLPQQ
jgi:hypothetical protein